MFCKTQSLRTGTESPPVERVNPVLLFFPLSPKKGVQSRQSLRKIVSCKINLSFFLLLAQGIFPHLWCERKCPEYPVAKSNNLPEENTLKGCEGQKCPGNLLR